MTDPELTPVARSELGTASSLVFCRRWTQVARAASASVRETIAGQAQHALMPGPRLGDQLVEAGLELAGIDTERYRAHAQLSAAIAAASAAGVTVAQIAEAIQAGDPSVDLGDTHQLIDEARRGR